LPDPFLEAQLELDRMINAHIMSVSGYYKAAMLEITSELAEFHKRFMDPDNPPTRAEIRRLIQTRGIYEGVKTALERRMRQAQNFLQEAAPEFYRDAWTRWGTAQKHRYGGLVNLGLGNPDEKLIEKALSNPFSKLRQSSVLGQDRDYAVGLVRDQMTLGLTRGESIDDVSRRIGKVLGFRDQAGRVVPTYEGELYKIARITRTELGRLATEAHLDRFYDVRSTGIDVELIWVSTLDSRTRPDHQELDEVAADRNGEWVFPDGVKTRGPGLSGHAHQDINCRCTITERLGGTQPGARIQQVENEGRITTEVGEFKNFKGWSAGNNTGPVQVAPERPVVTYPKVIPDTITNVSGLNKWLKENNVADVVNFKGTPLPVAKEYAQSWLNTLNIAPSLRSRMSFFGTIQERNRYYRSVKVPLMESELRRSGRFSEERIPNLARKNVDRYIRSNLIASKGDIAHHFAEPGFMGITINETFHKGQYQRALIMSVQTGFHPPGCTTLKSVFDHEMGHLLDSRYGVRGSVGFQALYEKYRLRIGAELSNYATKNTAETIAEAWSEYLNNPQPREIAKAIGDYMRSMFKNGN